MSATVTRMDRTTAIAFAKAFVNELEGTYLDLRIAGSLRRRMGVAKDIEVVAIPKIGHVPGGLFEDMAVPMDLLSARLELMLQDGRIEKRLDSRGSPRWGPLTKYLTYQGVRVDLFTSPADRFGWILLLRTGPAEFSRQLVMPTKLDNGKAGRTSDGRPGLLPVHLKPNQGLTYRTSGERIETPTERSVFELFSIPYVEPWERV